ncbi:MAG TPA: hypothetical protein VGR88_09045, partial [Ktedonobacterales bacterium]|nr:hypothetical protein [Ktedonobacterales bacterium]
APVVGVAYAMFEVFYERWSSKSALFQPVEAEETGGADTDAGTRDDIAPPEAPPLTYKPRPKTSDLDADDAKRETLTRGAGTPR